MDTSKRLVRSRTDKMVGGVCGGLGEYFGIDPTLIRIAFAMLVVFGAGSPLLLYVLLWVIIPAADKARGLLEVGKDGTTDSPAMEPIVSTIPTPVDDAAPAADGQAQEPVAG